MMLNYKHLIRGSLLLAVLTVVGCGSSGPARSAITGSVTVGGQPLPAGRIIFTPIAPNSGPVVTARVIAGKYQVAKGDGPVVGKNRVAVEADLNLGFALDDEEAFIRRGGSPIPQSPIPPGFGVDPEVSVEVKPDDTNQFDVIVPAADQTASY